MNVLRFSLPRRVSICLRSCESNVSPTWCFIFVFSLYSVYLVYWKALLVLLHKSYLACVVEAFVREDFACFG